MRNQLNQPLTQEQIVKLLGSLAQKIHTNMLGDMLKETPIINPTYLPAQMTDGQYLSLLRLALQNSEIKQRTIDVIKNFCDEGVNIDSAFETEQAKILKEISPKIRHKDIKEFFENELLRLSEAGVQPEQIEIKQDGLISREALAQKKKVNLLIGLDESDKDLPLNTDKFSWLIREYTNDMNEIMKNPKNVDVKKTNLERTGKIATLIANNQESLERLQGDDIQTNPELISDIIKFMHAMSYKGDIGSFKILEDKLGEENLEYILSSIPLEKESQRSFDGLITLKGIISIINKRAHDNKRSDSAEWKELYTKLNDFFEIKKQSDGPAARSTRVRGGEGGPAENVAIGKGMLGGGPAKG